jgi:hypothetical protein
MSSEPPALGSFHRRGPLVEVDDAEAEMALSPFASNPPRRTNVEEE